MQTQHENNQNPQPVAGTDPKTGLFGKPVSVLWEDVKANM
jgi:hypothetical protein